MRLSYLFTVCSNLCKQESFGVEYYSVSQNNLDNVFISFVREQCESEKDYGSSSSAKNCSLAVTK